MNTSQYFSTKIKINELINQELSIKLIGHISNLFGRQEPKAKQEEKLLGEYVTKGESCFADLEGSYIIIIYNKDIIKVIADRVSSRKIYYYYNCESKTVYLAERITNLFEMGVPKVYNRFSLFEY